jgi:glyoxylase-like metal-dependent hydrolase (beta-lactamase superfamily II)
VKYHFFSHSDDVADGAKYAKAFGSQRIIHRGDQRGMKDAEILLEGIEPVCFGKDFLVIPTPGHTRGHSVLLYEDKFLFTGDHLWFSRRTGHLGASHQYNWYSWKEQTQSMKRLENYNFEWVLPGHGRQAHFAPAHMKQELHQLIEQMPSM